MKYLGNEKYIIIPDEIDGKPVTKIGNRAFENMGIVYLALGENITEIGEYAFSDSTYPLKEIIWNNKLRAIGECAFLYSEIDSINFPASLEYIGGHAFCFGFRLKAVNLEEGSRLQYIGSQAFAFCPITSLFTIPKSVSFIDYAAFQDTELKGFTVDEENAFYCCVDGVLYNKDKTELACYPSAKEAEVFEVPSSVKKLGQYSFYRVCGIKKLVLNEGLEMIGQDSLSQCRFESDIVIPCSIFCRIRRSFLKTAQKYNTLHAISDLAGWDIGIMLLICRAKIIRF